MGATGSDGDGLLGAEVLQPAVPAPGSAPRPDPGQVGFPDQVRALMEVRGVNQKWLAAETGLDKAMVSRMMRGNGVGTVDAWVAIAQALGGRWELRRDG